MSCQSVEQVTVSGARMWTQRVPKGAASANAEARYSDTARAAKALY